MLWARHLLSAEERKRAEDMQKLPENAGPAAKNGQSNKPETPRRNRYSVRTDSGPVALRAFQSMQVEAMDWSGMGHAEWPQRSVFRPMRCAYGVIAWKIPVTKWTGDCCFIRVPGHN